MSDLPSPSKSPIPAICQSLVTEPGEPELLMVSPFINQMATSPLVWRHSMSALPSPLKSPTPAICQSLGTTPSEPPPMVVVPFISHRYTSPELLRQRMSALPSPLKSPDPGDGPVGGRPARRAAADLAGSAQPPLVEGAVIVAPQDVGTLVTVEVAAAQWRANPIRANIVCPGTSNTVEIRRWRVGQRAGCDSGGTRLEMVIAAGFGKERIGADGVGRLQPVLKGVIVLGVEEDEVVRVDVVNPRVPSLGDSMRISIDDIVRYISIIVWSRTVVVITGPHTDTHNIVRDRVIDDYEVGRIVPRGDASVRNIVDQIILYLTRGGQVDALVKIAARRADVVNDIADHVILDSISPMIGVDAGCSIESHGPLCAMVWTWLFMTTSYDPAR